ncbi:MAG: methyltransferase domain-containing protein [Rhodospirillales bacterium]|nr:MAG: methyltransferase domain-containing protein [Rhodospirillales bacterium]
MYTDVVDLRDFYAEPVGMVARRLLGARLRELWPDTRGLRVAGVGYAAPFLWPFLPEAERVLALMPAQQGVLHWPREGGNLSALVDETDLPLPDRSVDRMLVVHALECTERVKPLLREAWRALADGGRMVVVVPNRTGLWAQIDNSPFYQGYPYSARQLAALLRANMFTPLREARALYMPPVRSRLLLGMAPSVERFGARWLGRLAGVAMIEAGKQLYAGVAQREAPAAQAVRPRLRVARAGDSAAGRWSPRASTPGAVPSAPDPAPR